MSKNEFAPGENRTIRRSKEPTFITSASGQAESTDEATVNVNDSDFLVIMMLVEDSPAVLTLGCLGEEMGYASEWKKEESPSLIKDGKVMRCKSENYVPIGSFK